MERAVRPGDAGFTLLELVIVMAVMAVLSVTAVLAFGRAGPDAGSDAQRFEAAYEQQRDVAVFGGAPRAMLVTDRNWRIMIADRDGDGQLLWRPAGPAQRFQGVVRWRLPSFVTKTDTDPQIMFLPDGQVTPFRLWLGTEDRVTICTGTGWEGLTCQS